MPDRRCRQGAGPTVTRFEVARPLARYGQPDSDASEDDRVLRRLARTLVAAALAGSIVIAAGGFTLVQIGLRPVRDLAAQVQALAADTLDRRLTGRPNRKNSLPFIMSTSCCGALHRAYAQLEGFNADVAHELFHAAGDADRWQLKWPCAKRVTRMNCAMSSETSKNCSACRSSCRTCCSCRRQIGAHLRGEEGVSSLACCRGSGGRTARGGHGGRPA